MRKKKVLILYAPFGAGHGSVAKTIAQTFALKHPDIEVKNVNVLDFVFDIFKQSLPWAYNQTSFKAPLLYKWAYEYYNHQPRQKSFNNTSNLILKKSHFIKFIKEFNPDFIISTNPLPMHLISKTKEKNIVDILSANVCTDFGFHSFWHNKDVNYYFVANQEIKDSLIGHGVKTDKIHVTGIPVNLKFNKKLNRKKIFEKLSLDPSRPVLLIVGGRILYENLLEIVDNVRKKIRKLQFIIVAGRDKDLYENLKYSKIRKYKSVRIFDFVDNLDEFMTVTDLILTKAGGLTVSECLVKNLPMLINDIIPGQEEDNVNYAVKNGFGIKSDSTEETIKIIKVLFSKPKKLAEMKQNCRNMAKPNAAKDVVDFIVSKINF